jgi:pimeloyl-ACP methyl ester carboxylesterase
VGHSGGGLTASQVAELVPERVAALVYLVGMMLPSGMTFADLITAQPDGDFAGMMRTFQLRFSPGWPIRHGVPAWRSA